MSNNTDLQNEIVISIDRLQGEFIASNSKLEFRKDDLVLETGTIKVGEKTDLHGLRCLRCFIQQIVGRTATLVAFYFIIYEYL